MNMVFKMVISDARMTGPRQKVYLKDEMYLTEKKMREARQIDNESST